MYEVLRKGSVMFGRKGRQMIKNGVVRLVAMFVFTDDLVLMVESAGDLRVMLNVFTVVCREC